MSTTAIDVEIEHQLSKALQGVAETCESLRLVVTLYSAQHEDDEDRSVIQTADKVHIDSQYLGQHVRELEQLINRANLKPKED